MGTGTHHPTLCCSRRVPSPLYPQLLKPTINTFSFLDYLRAMEEDRPPGDEAVTQDRSEAALSDGYGFLFCWPL